MRADVMMNLIMAKASVKLMGKPRTQQPKEQRRADGTIVREITSMGELRGFLATHGGQGGSK